MPAAEDADAALCTSVWTFHRALGEVMDPLLARVGVTNGQFFLLFFIAKMPRPTVGQIAGMLGTRMSTVTHLINDLEEHGLVRRERSSDDRRLVRLVVSSRGSKLLTRIESLSLDQVRTASSGIPDARKTDAANLLEEVAAHLLSSHGVRARPVVAGARPVPTPAKKSKPTGDRR